MEEVEFYIIHNIALEASDIASDYRLETIGVWYSRFLNSEEKNLTLVLPSYNYEFTKTTYEYLSYFLLCYNFHHQRKLLNLENTCLFNVFNYKLNRNSASFHEYILDYKTSNNKTALWSTDTITELNKFLPIFKKNQIKTKKDLEVISNTFKIFKKFREHQIINYPILIDFEENISLIFNCINNNTNEMVSQITIPIDERMNDDEAANLEEKLKEKKINQRINLKYPYSKKTHNYLLEDIGLKRLNLVFNNRFFHLDYTKEDIILLPKEYISTESPLLEKLQYDIINTNHNIILFNLLKDFKKEWINQNLNKFTAPFPKYWFLFINNGMSKEHWIALFKNDYPSVAEKPIIRQIEKIISELHDLNWIEKGIAKFGHTAILFPELKGLRKKRLNTGFNSFKNYVFKINPECVFITDESSFKYDNLILLDAYNIIDLANKTQYNLEKNLTVVVPDFIYFSYQPWIKYHLFTYQSSILINDCREKLDENFGRNKSEITLLRNEILFEVKGEIKLYNKKYEIEEPLLVESEIIDGEDIELLNEEENDIIQHDYKNKKTSLVIITTTEGEELNVQSNEVVLMQRDSFIKSLITSLKKGDLFLRYKDLKTLILDDNFFNKLSEIPSSIKSYQNDLKKYNNIYVVLKNKGISYSGQSYFETNYLLPLNELNEVNFRIPRRKNDWLIICDLLSIDHSRMNIAFIAYYGRKKKNRVIELYKLVINLFLEKDYFGMSNHPIILSEIENIIDDFKDIFIQDIYYNPREISESIASSLMNELKFKEVKEIKLLNDE